MKTNSLTFRLTALSLFWIVIALLGTAWVLSHLYREHIEEHFDGHVETHLEELIAALEKTGEGEYRLARLPTDPRFYTPGSGWYWVVQNRDGIIAASSSLAGQRLALDGALSEEHGSARVVKGPGGQVLRAQVASVSLPGESSAFTFAATAPEMQISDDVDAYFWHIMQAFAMLGVGLGLAVLMQVRVALRPLKAIREGIADVRGGHATRLARDFPSDVQPLVDELNFVLDHNETLLKRARNQLADLAHAVKNPLTVIRNEARNLTGREGKLILEQTYQMGSSIDHTLSRARVFGRQDALGYRTSVRSVIEDLRYALEHIHKERQVELRLACVEDRWFRGEAQDLEEMAGNLLDNACKWARSVVQVGCRSNDDHFVLVIDDDGPGIPPEEVDNVLRRGRKLDDTAPGHGHGLAIVRDIAELYGGGLALGRSELGGLRVELTLPSA